MRHIERQNDFWTKNANNSISSKIWEYWTDVYLRIVKLESATSYKEKISPKIVLTLKNPLFIKSTKTIRFYPNHRKLNSYTFALLDLKSRA